MKMFSYVGDTVLDPFVGSGTTMISAIRNERNSIGIETEEKYCLDTFGRLIAEKTLFDDIELDYIDDPLNLEDRIEESVV